jgi:hypothetical protein
MIGKTWRVAALATAAFLLTAQRAPDTFLSYSPQGWNEDQRNLWYNSSQGSRLMPLSWMQALERHQDETLFLTPENVERYRYLTYTTPSGSALPVGFAEDRQSDRNLRVTKLRWLPNQGDQEPWVGFTCAACHTNEVAVGERRLRVDGAPGMGDFQSFTEQVDRSLAATRANPAKWARFSQRVLGARDNDRNRQRLGRAVDQHIAYRREIGGMNSTPTRYGFSRVDAIGYIFNQASFFTQAGHPIANEPSAPVSYPFLWNITQHNRVQWNGSVPNRRIPLRGSYLDIGALGRNTGEVIGVFGEVVTHRHSALGILRPFHSSVRVQQLVGLETMLESLQPPAWPEDLLGRIDQASARRGAALYERDCASCHVPLARTDLTTPVIAQMSLFPRNAPPQQGRRNIPPGTDPLMACNAFYNSAASGNLENFKSGSQRIGVIAPNLDLLSVEVIYSLAGEWREILSSAFKIYEGGTPAPRVEERHRRRRSAGPRAAAAPPPPPPPVAAAATAAGYPNLPARYVSCVNASYNGPEYDILGYKARPLTGIWATGPYLHNGSVPNLYELLLPPAQRTPHFYTGTRQFDPERVGYQITPSNENSFLYRTRDDQGNIVWGNFNGGHDYDNARLSHRDRMDLVEYLKTL